MNDASLLELLLDPHLQNFHILLNIGRLRHRLEMNMWELVMQESVKMLMVLKLTRVQTHLNPFSLHHRHPQLECFQTPQSVHNRYVIGFLLSF